MEYLYVKKYHKYQHYSDRSMVWVKLHLSTLNDYKFMKLTTVEKWIFIGFILLSARNKNKIPNDNQFIIHELSLNDVPEKELELAIKNMKELELIASKVLARCLPRIDKIRIDKKR